VGGTLPGVVQGVLFDLFHTLTGPESEWDDLPWTFEVLGFEWETWNSLLVANSRWRLAGQERDPVQIVTRLARQLNPAVSPQAIERAVEVRLERFRRALLRIPAGNVDLLKTLRAAGIRTALVSNADAMEVAAWPSSPLAGLFDVEVFSFQVGAVKPEPEIFQHCLYRLGLKAADCVFVGDGGSNELAGARAVGLRTVFVSGVMAELWPDAVAGRAAVADHHIVRADELLTIPGFETVTR